MVQEISFEDISYQELCQSFFSVEQNHLCNFGRGHHEKHFYEIILNLDKWFRRICHLKTVLIKSSGDPCIKPSENNYAIMVEAIMRNNSMKVF